MSRKGPHQLWRLVPSVQTMAEQVLVLDAQYLALHAHKLLIISAQRIDVDIFSEDVGSARLLMTAVGKLWTCNL